MNVGPLNYRSSAVPATGPVSIFQQHSIYEILVKLPNFRAKLVNQLEVPDKTSSQLMHARMISCMTDYSDGLHGQQVTRMIAANTTVIVQHLKHHML